MLTGWAGGCKADVLVGTVAVWRAQAKRLAPYFRLALLLALASRSLWSLYSPCGPWGRGYTNISICGSLASLNGCSFHLSASNPLLFNSSMRRSASLRLGSSFVGSTVTPNCSFLMGLPNFPVSCNMEMSAGGCTTTRIFCRHSAISVANVAASTSPWLYQKLAPSEFGGNDPSSLASCVCCSSLNRRHATLASISALANAAFSAFWLADPARSFALDASTLVSESKRSLALRNSAFLFRNSALLPRIWPLRAAILIPTTSSPATPAVIKRTLAISILSFVRDGLPGGRSTPKYANAHASISSRHSCRITHSSSATPTTTQNVNTHTERSQGGDKLSSALISVSRADMALSRAEMELF